MFVAVGALTPNNVECTLLFPSPAPFALDDAMDYVEFFRKSSSALEASSTVLFAEVGF
jgi:hypothetical protein